MVREHSNKCRKMTEEEVHLSLSHAHRGRELGSQAGESELDDCEWVAKDSLMYDVMCVVCCNEQAGAEKGPVTREYTINLHKKLHKITRKRRAPRALREVRKFARKEMGTSDVRISTHLNKKIWANGINHVPFRIRVQISRARNEDEEAAETMYSFVTPAELPSSGFKGLGTQIVEE